ncbi:DUF4097 domain-containing protein [Staphylococcus americanisciuri]|uniref:DUF4097 domain-containing protein n=1 Tax=Staphylococcus americanisciuri TaxID=2973940 RepID=A0ABT2F396_9STAP|nr:DUF4097 domain-containing protein [Staphylococcus americanisciuri]MCS4486931.1 DUF4097 domain-containing protein [Staphylococcus americanisciuri]
MTQLNQTFDAAHIEQLVVNTDNINVTFKSGEHLNLSYKGKDKLNVTRQGHTLQLTEQMLSKRKMLNLNPFASKEGHLTVTIPAHSIQNLNVTTRIANIALEGIKLDNVMLWNDLNGQVRIRNSHFKNTQIKGYETFVNIHCSELSESDIHVERGIINTKDTTVQKSLFKLGEGDMHLLNMAPHCDLKGVVNKGDIEMSYAQLPQNVRLSLHPSNGKAIINHRHLKEGVNGKGKHQIELYTNDGNIVINP